MSVTIDGPADFPALYRSADRESERAQRSYLRSLRVRLGALLVAAFGGALTLTTAAGFQVGGGLAFLAFARWAPSSSSPGQPLTTWYEGRAAAESAKTLAWRYMVRAEPFEGAPRRRQAIPCPDPLAAARPSVDLIGDSRTRCAPDQRQDAPSPRSRLQ